MRTVVLSTCGSRKEAGKIARDIVERRLVACVNIMPVTSCYRWKGRTRLDREFLIIAKTRSELFSRLKARILALNTYQLPEIVYLKIEGGFKQYLGWIDEEVRR